MTNDFCLADILDEMASRLDLGAMTDLLLEIRDAYGLANLVYHTAHLPGCMHENPILVLSYEDNWVKRYVGENYFAIDPAVRDGIRAFLPVDWSSLDRRPSAIEHFFREAESYGVGRQGVTIPVHGPQGERALFSLTCNLTDDAWREQRIEMLREFHILAHFFHDRAVYLSGLRSDPPPRLSRREAECIRLLAQGRKPKFIAHALGISESAIRLYTGSARTKLRCATLTQAVARAVSMGIVVG